MAGAEMIPNYIMRWLGPAIVAVIGAIVIFGNPITHAALCDGTGNCVATWVSALSGWAAAFAAAITVRSLFQQAKAAQAQTDFQLGNAEPTLDAVQHTERKTRVALRIRNWNRRSMIVRRIRLVTSKKISTLHISFDREKKVELYPIPKQDWTFSKGSTKRFDPGLMIEGWVRRDQEPPLLKISVAGYFVARKEIETWHEIPIEIQYELVGIRKVFRLLAHVHLASAAIDADDDLAELERELELAFSL